MTATVSALPVPLLVPHLLEHWPDLYEAARANRKPEVAAHADGRADVESLVAYTRRIGPLQTADTKRAAAALAEVIAANQHATYGARRVLLIDGPSTMGKTQAVLAAALRDANAIWAANGHRVDGRLVVPYIYVEVGAAGWARSLMQSICEFAAIPATSRDRTEDLIARFRLLAPQLSVKAVIVDDAHMLRTATAESRRLTDFLKGLITSVPASFVFVGAGLRDSALLRQSTRGGYSAAEQVARRATVLDLAPWKVSDCAWTELLANLQRQLVFPRGTRCTALAVDGTALFLHQRSGGHPGLVIDWVKRAAVRALQRGGGLSLETLRATAPRRLA